MYISDAEIGKEIPDWVTLCNLDIDPLHYCGSSSQIIKSRIIQGHPIEALSLLCMRALMIGMTHSNQSLEGIPVLEERYGDDTEDFLRIVHVLTL